MGHIQLVSPRKKTRYGGTHFDLQLQDSPTSSVKVKVFGDSNYEKAVTLKRQRSPVKMRLVYNNKYRNYQLNDRERIEKCNNMEVAFDPSDVPADNNLSGTPTSTMVKISEVHELSLNNDNYYSVHGVIILGWDENIDAPLGTVKEDIALVDETGHIQLKVWDEQNISRISSKKSYTFTHLKLRRRDEGKFLTTSPKTEISLIPDLEISIPTINLFGTQQELVVKKVKRLAGIDRFFSCRNQSCRKKLPDIYASTGGPIHCENCGEWMAREDLQETTMVHMVFDLHGEELKLTGAAKVLRYVVPDWSDDKKIAISLFALKNFMLTYSIISKMILHVTTEEEIVYGDCLSDGDSSVKNPSSDVLMVKNLDNPSASVEEPISDPVAQNLDKPSESDQKPTTAPVAQNLDKPSELVEKPTTAPVAQNLDKPSESGEKPTTAPVAQNLDKPSESAEKPTTSPVAQNLDKPTASVEMPTSAPFEQNLNKPSESVVKSNSGPGEQNLDKPSYAAVVGAKQKRRR